MWAWSVRRTRGEYESKAFGPLRDLDAQRRLRQRVKADTHADVADKGAQHDRIEARSDHACVVEKGHVDRHSIRDPPPLARHEHRVAIAEAPAAVAAQGAAAAERWQQKIRDLITIVERRLQSTAQRDDPVLPQDGNVLHDL